MSNEDSGAEQEASEMAHAISGAGAGALSMLVTYPLVTVSTKMQSEDKDLQSKGRPKKTAKEVIKEIYSKDGILGYYAGLESAVYGIAITNFVYYYFYELSVHSIKDIMPNSQLNTIQTMASGAIAGSFTAVASNPIWIANTRMTVTKSNKSTLSTIIQIVKEDGPLALFSGLKPALVLVLNPIIQYTVFERLKNTILSTQRTKDQTATLSPIWAFFLGALGKLIATGVTYPYLTLKTRLHLAGDKNCTGKSSKEDDVKKEKITMLSETLKILKNDGISGFYRGAVYKLTQSILTAAFLFFFKEGLTTWVVRLLSVLRGAISINNVALKTPNTKGQF